MTIKKEPYDYLPPTYKYRTFLNKESHGSLAALEVECVTDTKYGYTDIHLSITDCYKQVSLTFWLGSEEGRENALEKLEILRESITKMEQWVINALPAARQMEAQKKKEHEKKKSNTKTST